MSSSSFDPFSCINSFTIWFLFFLNLVKYWRCAILSYKDLNIFSPVFELTSKNKAPSLWDKTSASFVLTFFSRSILFPKTVITLSSIFLENEIHDNNLSYVSFPKK